MPTHVDHDHAEVEAPVEGQPNLDPSQPVFNAKAVATEVFQSLSAQISDGNLSMNLKPVIGDRGAGDFSHLLERYGQQGIVEIRHPEGDWEHVTPEQVSRQQTTGQQTGTLAWGGYQNGRIPTEQMMRIDGVHHKGSAPHYFEPSAGQAFQAMVQVAAQDGVTIRLTDSYRSYDAQVSVRQRKGGQVATATPGTSVHGWGRAIDVAGDAARKWIQENGRRFGWIWPEWAQRQGTKSYEPWHYEFYSPPAGGVAAASGGTPQSVAQPTVSPDQAARQALQEPVAQPAPRSGGVRPV